MRRFLMILIIVSLNLSTAHASEIKSFIPTDHLPEFLAKNFDLMTIRSSLGPRRIGGKHNYLVDFYPSPIYAKDEVTVDVKGDWYYSFKILKVKDSNDDGVMDLDVCFRDKAKNGGSYDTQTPLTLTRYSKDMPLVALSYDPHIKDCQKLPKKEE